MLIEPIRLEALLPPKDDLHEKIRHSTLALQDGDIVAITSKVVSIGEGRCVPIDEGVDAAAHKEALIIEEAEQYLPPLNVLGFHTMHTITYGALVGSAGIDRSNSNGFYTLYPKDPSRSARELQAWLCETYSAPTLGVVITDSRSTPLRRGASGFALAWHGFSPTRDYRGEQDIFGREMRVEMANIADGLAAAAVLAMGEGAQQTPLALIRDVPAIEFGDPTLKEPFIVPIEEDLFAPFLQSVDWKKGKAS